MKLNKIPFFIVLFITSCLLADQLCSPPLPFFEVTRESLGNGWVHTTGEMSNKTRKIQVDYIDNRENPGLLFDSQGYVILTNLSDSRFRLIKYRHTVDLPKGSYIIHQEKDWYQVCAEDGEVIFFVSNRVGSWPVTHHWAYSVEISPYGDLNGDGCVDGADLGLVMSAWGTNLADFNNDGITNGLDVGIFFENWTGNC